MLKAKLCHEQFTKCVCVRMSVCIKIKLILGRTYTFEQNP